MNVRLISAALAVTLGVLLSACGGSDPDGTGDIASLASGPPKAGSPAPADERPLIRNDMSTEEADRLTNVWLDCLKKNGAPDKATYVQREKTMSAAERKRMKDASDKASQACLHKQPEQLWERAQRTDPEYADKLRAWVTCARSHGIKAWESENVITYEKLPPPEQMKKVHECEDKIFSGVA